MNFIVEERPLDINLEVTNFCPLKCVFCPNRKIKRNKKTMSLLLFEKICDDYYSIGGGAMGISSMQSDIFSDSLLAERLAILKKYSDKFHIHTTTNLISSHKFDENIIKNFLETFSFIEISLGGVEKEEYERMYGVDAFDIFKKQLELFRKIIDDNNLDIKVSLAIRTHQKKEIVKTAEFQELKSLFGISDIKDKFFSWYGQIEQDELPQGAELLVANNKGKIKDCVVPFATMSINTDGTVLGCGCIDWESRYPVGDITQNSIKEIWNSPKCIAFRESFSQGKMPCICTTCGLYIEKETCFSSPSLINYKVTDGLYYNQ